MEHPFTDGVLPMFGVPGNADGFAQRHSPCKHSPCKSNVSIVTKRSEKWKWIALWQAAESCSWPRLLFSLQLGGLRRQSWFVDSAVTSDRDGLPAVNGVKVESTCLGDPNDWIDLPAAGEWDVQILEITSCLLMRSLTH